MSAAWRIKSLVINAGLSAWLVIAVTTGLWFLLPATFLGAAAFSELAVGENPGRYAFLTALMPYVVLVVVAGLRTRLVADREHVLVRNGLLSHRLRADEIGQVDIEEEIFRAEGGGSGFCVRLRCGPGSKGVRVLATAGLGTVRKYSACEADARRLAAFLGCDMARPAHLAEPPESQKGRLEVRGLVKLIAAVVVFGLVWIVVGWGIDRLGGGDDRGPPDGVDVATIDEWDAYDACQREVTRDVDAPAGTARFPDLFDHDDEIVITGSGTTLTIRAHVEAWSDHTSGMVRTDWTCRATKTSDGWSGESTLL